MAARLASTRFSLRRAAIAGKIQFHGRENASSCQMGRRARSKL
jgi:hypothetical protein